MTLSPLDFILSQIDAASPELELYQPEGIDWQQRAVQSASRLTPWLASHAADLCNYVASIMNSPNDVRASANAIIKKLESSSVTVDKSMRKQIELLRSSLKLEEHLILGAGGTVVSKLIEGYLIAKSQDWILESNGASDYPDLFFRSSDYTKLPAFKRGRDQVYGASVKGKSKRPVRIPDGLEIKTCKKRFAVDCHHAHVGLHLVLVFELVKSRFSVKGIYLGFMRHSLYRITVPATPTTTLKASFNGDHFIELNRSQ